MNCIACGQPLAELWKFCPECGGRVAGKQRSAVFEVIVNAASTGATWKEFLKGPMETNQITVEEVEREVERRRLQTSST